MQVNITIFSQNDAIFQLFVFIASVTYHVCIRSWKKKGLPWETTLRKTAVWEPLSVKKENSNFDKSAFITRVGLFS